MNGEIRLDILKASLVGILQEATGVEPFIFEDQAGPRPESGNYGTLKFITPLVMEGQDSETVEANGDNVTIKTEGQRELTLSIQIFRENAFQKMGLLQTKIQSRRFRESARFTAKARGQSFAFIDALSIQDLSALLNSNYEERAQMDVRIRVVSSMSETVETIGEVVLDGTIKDVADQVKGAGKLTISDS